MEKNVAPPASRKPASRGLFQSILAPRKLAFYTLFHGFHMFIFVLGW
jgi:NADPH oxidase